jgi:hypothetical protein
MRRLPCIFTIAMAFTGSTSAAAAAMPQWFGNGKAIPVGVVEPVATHGMLKMALNNENERETVSTIRCTVSDAEKIQNTPTGGIDEITSFTFAGCTFKPSPCTSGGTPELVAERLPWQSELTAQTPIADNLVASVSVRCSGQVLVPLGGTVGPRVGKSALNFFGEPLFGPHRYEMAIQGMDRLKGPKGNQRISAH